MSKRNIILAAGAGLLVLAFALYQISAINSRVAWRFEVARIYAKNVLHPVGGVPTAIPSTPKPTVIASATVAATVEVVETSIPPTPTLAPPPPQASLNSPPYEKQTANNC